jgi:hypothetical protein
MEFIQLRDALTLMETPVDGLARKFSLNVITYDDQRGTGGELLSFTECTLLGVKTEYTNTIPEEYRREQPALALMSKDPHHRVHKTRNIRLKNGQVRKIHIRFITHFDGKQILY